MVQTTGTPATGGPLIEIENVSARTDRGEEIFGSLNFSLSPGRSAVIVGGAGSGKTTLVELLLGLRAPVAGRIEMFGESISKRGAAKRARRKIGGVGGPFGLISTLTVEENILMPLIISGERSSLQTERLHRLLGEFNLLKMARQYPSSLTRVEYMLVQIARASIASQPLMLIDEPSAGLDHTTYLRVLEYLHKASLFGRSMLIMASEKPPLEIPNSSCFTIANGRLV
jgi:ABC-type lipoprotein export system ATPase subunit